MIINDVLESYIFKKIESLCNFNYLYNLIQNLFYKYDYDYENNYNYELLYTTDGLNMILIPQIPPPPSLTIPSPSPLTTSTPSPLTSPPTIPTTSPSTPSPTLSNWQCEICKTFNTFKESNCIDCKINPEIVPFMREIIDEIVLTIDDNNKNKNQKVTIIPTSNIYESDGSVLDEWEYLDEEQSNK